MSNVSLFSCPKILDKQSILVYNAYNMIKITLLLVGTLIAAGIIGAPVVTFAEQQQQSLQLPGLNLSQQQQQASPTSGQQQQQGVVLTPIASAPAPGVTIAQQQQQQQQTQSTPAAPVQQPASPAVGQQQQQQNQPGQSQQQQQSPAGQSQSQTPGGSQSQTQTGQQQQQTTQQVAQAQTQTQTEAKKTVQATKLPKAGQEVAMALAGTIASTVGVLGRKLKYNKELLKTIV